MSSVAIGSTVLKDVQAITLYTINWATFLTDLSLTIASASWVISLGDGLLTSDQESNTTTTTTIRLSAGTVGQLYRVECRVVLSGSPSQTEPESFYVQVYEA